MNDSEDGAGRNRRETPASVTNNRAARALVASVQERLGTWQAEAVKLEVMAERLGAAGRRDPGLAQAVRDLLGGIKLAAEQFEVAVADSVDAVRLHTRVTDTQMVLARLIDRLERVLNEQAEPPDRPR